MKSSPEFAYETNAMADEYEEGRPGVDRDMFVRVAVADHCIIVILQFLERAWPWLSKRLESMLDFDSRMIKCRRGVLLPLPVGVIERVCRVDI